MDTTVETYKVFFTSPRAGWWKGSERDTKRPSYPTGTGQVSKTGNSQRPTAQLRVHEAGVRGKAWEAKGERGQGKAGER